ncbi:hypothetical protein LEP1GSC137_3798 [Leptospira borgpetersenii str. Noumea 25]|uniref:Uncharacterized protein n=1 Tax=Leptospira borgpetersenii serovar Ballum TaxID=280505 RepID=A0A0S2ITN2_LEPBO|nr:hypothetical protein LBBP_02602 [Leptospira borgpetersenii serovar Ballum]EKR01261.1 hypothetical protein LEP1GSC121_2816 [Leptospira borgpetersenii serovar Castellonis str. 200801910]EMO10743.1 hypothetical protein LEP1GSC137_3798 [Leptospira borgpetersenii str. Noumea 25]OOV42425.1 hypothetical protein B1H38_15720 [Leptospira borgpetersenii serovar Ballum]
MDFLINFIVEHSRRSSYIRGFRTSSKLSVSKTKSSPKETHLFDYTTSQFRMIRFTITVVTKKCPT